MGAPNQLTPQQLAQVNMQARMAVLANAVEMTQQIAAIAVDPSAQTVINIPPRNVGLIKGFIVEVNGTLRNTGGGAAANITPFGAANVLSNIQFQDLNNQVRINTTGWHIALLNSAKQGFGFGGAYAPNLPMGYGNNWTVQSLAATLANATDAPVRQIYYVPLAYAADDLRGAIYAGVVNATMNLQLTINANPFTAAGDPTPAVYSGAAGGWKAATTVQVTVYQVYLDQLPRGEGGVILPPLDLNTIYELKQTSVQGMTVGQDFPYAYANFRDFLSTIAVYDNAGVLNTGSDVNYWSLVSANFTQLFKITPEIAALQARQTFMADPPKGTYYFDHRRRPINTVQFGNMELNLNASAVTAGASLLVATEAFAQINTLVSSASLSAG